MNNDNDDDDRLVGKRKIGLSRGGGEMICVDTTMLGRHTDSEVIGEVIGNIHNYGY